MLDRLDGEGGSTNTACMAAVSVNIEYKGLNYLMLRLVMGEKGLGWLHVFAFALVPT